jgi:hypothetical protein
MAKKSKFTKEDDDLLNELGVETKVAKAVTHTPREERIIAGFEEIQRFVDEHGHLPQHGEDRDIFERLYAVRLDRIMASSECLELLKNYDNNNLLTQQNHVASNLNTEPDTDEELLEMLGVDANGTNDVTQLKHVRSRAEIKAAEEIAQRETCENFDEQFRPTFELVQQEINDGFRKTTKYQDNASMAEGDFFILDGQKVLIESMGNEFKPEHGRKDRRLRVIYDNGTESNILLRSLQRALNKDDNSRRILPSDTDKPALFSNTDEDDDQKTGHIYVLQSLSDHPFIAKHRNLIHKIGFTSGDVNKRISSAEKDPTYLRSKVKLEISYKLANLNGKKLEKLLHHFFADVRMDFQLQNQFGDHVKPEEWFCVPSAVIMQAIELLTDNNLDNCKYDAEKAQIINTKTGEAI